MPIQLAGRPDHDPGEHGGDPAHLLGTAPIYALAPGGAPARLGFVVPILNEAVEIPVTLRTNTDYGLDFTIQDLPEEAPAASLTLTLWGVPTETIHDSQRFAAGSAAAPAGCPEVEGTSCIAGPEASSLPRLPLLQSPTNCPGPFVSTLGVNTYQQPAVFRTASANAIGSSGCEDLEFSPQMLTALSSAETNTQTGLALELGLPPNTDPDGVAPAAVRNLSLTLPVGMRVNDTAAAAASTCTDAQFGLGSGAPVACPGSAKVGTFELDLAGFDAALAGDAYFGTPAAGGDYRLFLTAAGAGISAKLSGRLQPATASNPVTLALANIPQLPLSGLRLDLAPVLVTPSRCGDHQVTGTFVPWSSPDSPIATVTDELTLDSVGPNAGPCPGPASAVGVALSPASIPADGSSTSVVTATVSDADGVPVDGEDVAFTSTDPGQRIGAVTDNGNGTYTATVTASTRVGGATITATDISTDPDLAGSAGLGQSAPTKASATPPPAAGRLPLRRARAARPTVRLTMKPSVKTRDRTPSFRFTATVAGAGFSCRVDGRPRRRCESPTTLAKLDFGTHSFSVRATGAGGAKSKPATYSFTVLRPQRP